VRDRRYSTAAWQKLRRLVIARAGGVCEVRGPRCTFIATSAHHRLPSSQFPQEFWNPANLQASCASCNAHGAAVKAENRVNRQTIAHLESVIETQQFEIQELRAELASRENGSVRPARVPRIH
jgi:5-methylcytosine-specific restriction endonuclease McrA